MSYQVKLETFEGPLDLLLYLIRKNDMDIREIEISKITEQYLGFLNAMRTLDVDLASEFIVMAATLIYIKSKMLLPKPQEETPEDEMDPREALIQRLIEYQKYKIAAESLTKKPHLNEDLFKVHLVPQKIQQNYDPKEQLTEVGIYELALAFQEMIERSKKIVHHIEAEAVTVEEKIIDIVSRLKKTDQETVHFKSFFSDRISRVEIVVTFMAILELTRLQCLRLHQMGHMTDIHVKVTKNLASFDYQEVQTTIRGD